MEITKLEKGVIVYIVLDDMVAYKGVIEDVILENLDFPKLSVKLDGGKIQTFYLRNCHTSKKIASEVLECQLNETIKKYTNIIANIW